MTKIGLFYGTTTGKTETAAEMIQAELVGDSVVTSHDLADAKSDICHKSNLLNSFFYF